MLNVVCSKLLCELKINMNSDSERKEEVIKINAELFPLILLGILLTVGLLVSQSADSIQYSEQEQLVECANVTLGEVKLSVPQQHMTPKTPRKGNSGNFIFAFDSSVEGIECPVGCKELFVNISAIGSSPKQKWEYLEPEFTGRTTGKYHIYLTRFDREISKPSLEILVPLDAVNAQNEFYPCGLEGSVPYPGCYVFIVAKNGLVADFSIQRKVLVRARDAASFVAQSIDQFSENYSKGICK